MSQPGSQNVPSNLLSHEENDLIFTLVGQRKQVSEREIFIYPATAVIPPPFLLRPHPTHTHTHIFQTKATAVVQMFHANQDRHSWTKFRTGVVCFVKDNVKKSYYIRLFDLSVSLFLLRSTFVLNGVCRRKLILSLPLLQSKSMVYEQELYNQFTYKQDRPYFHSFPGDVSVYLCCVYIFPKWWEIP